MTTDHRVRRTSTSPPAQRISGPGELLQAVPYLLGFHPRHSLVLVGLDAGLLVVTARLDLSEAQQCDVVEATIRAMHRGGSSSVIGAVYDDDAVIDQVGPGLVRPEQVRPKQASPKQVGPVLPWSDVAASVGFEAADVGCEIVDVLLVSCDRWWSYTCAVPDCCPPEGRPLPDAPSSFTAAATYAGVVALPDREALEALLDPLPDADRDRLVPEVAAAENASVAAALDGDAERHHRSVKRALFAAARAGDEPRRVELLPDAEVARFGAALAAIAVRDAVWMAVDDGRLDGRALWRELARRLPSPYDAAPLFLFGWAAWRHGDGALASISAHRAVASDPGYSAADLLLAALAQGVDPRQLPRLRLPRSA